MNSEQVIKKLEADGWYLARVRGSHHPFKHPIHPGLVTVKHPDGDIPTPTLYSIEREAGWRKELQTGARYEIHCGNTYQ